ncbi:MAG: hypothetical protein JW734_09675 [Candidatus Omnitrophica bacterium]|nr:hypothetical protein [Candidatus Omnitrophota bacterium]
MAKEELHRLKQAFFVNHKEKNLPSKKNKPWFTMGFLMTLSFSIVLIAFLLSYSNKDNKSSFSKTTKSSSSKTAKRLSNKNSRLEKKESLLLDPIESLFLIQETNKLKPLVKEFPITINGSSLATLVVNLKKPLNIYEDCLKVYFNDEPREIDLILKDYLYCSNSRDPVTLYTSGKPSLEITGQALGLEESDLNLYRITQLRIVFDLKTLPLDFKIKNIEIAKR